MTDAPTPRRVRKYKVTVRSEWEYLILSTDEDTAALAVDDVDIESGRCMMWDVLDVEEVSDPS